MWAAYDFWERRAKKMYFEWKFFHWLKLVVPENQNKEKRNNALTTMKIECN